MNVPQAGYKLMNVPQAGCLVDTMKSSLLIENAYSLIMKNWQTWQALISMIRFVNPIKNG